jgi:hypothetical protein
MSQAPFGPVLREVRRLGAAAPATLTDEQLLDAFIARRDEAASYRIAMNAKRNLARRRNREQRGARSEAAPAPEELSWREVQALLDEEIDQLPEMYRRVLVLCCLEEHSWAEAARRLGLKEGTVASRLARTRQVLQDRLARRGVALSALLAALALSREGASVGAGTIQATAAYAVAYAAEACAHSAVPARVAVLAKGVTATMLFSRKKLGAGGTGYGGTLGNHRLRAGQTKDLGAVKVRD